MSSQIVIVDYGKGNLASVRRALTDAGFDAVVSSDASCIEKASGIVLPGVGAFNDAMTTMNELGQSAAIRKLVERGVPFLGICLGLHLIFDWGDEGCEEGQRTEGLGLVPGHVRRMASVDAQGAKYKIPHVGWNSIEYADPERACPVFDGIADGSYFYFTHSYCAEPDDAADVVATTTHADTFASVVQHGNVYGAQFHPEKSSSVGLKMLVNFGKLVEGTR